MIRKFRAERTRGSANVHVDNVGSALRGFDGVFDVLPKLRFLFHDRLGVKAMAEVFVPGFGMREDSMGIAANDHAAFANDVTAGDERERCAFAVAGQQD